MEGSAEEARSADSSIPACSVPKHLLFALKTVICTEEMSPRRLSDMDEETIAGGKLFETLQCDGYRAFIRLSRSYFEERGDDVKVARYKLIRMPESAYASSCRAPFSRDNKRDDFKDFLDDGWSVFHRAITAESFSGSSEGQNDTVLVSEEAVNTV